MYCKNCNAFNEDSSRFCSTCGAPLTDRQPPYGEPQARPPYQQPYYGTGLPTEPTKPLSIVLPIVALILGILLADLPGILLGAFALVNFNRYTAALNAGDIGTAEACKIKSRRLATAGIVLTVVLFMLAVIVAAAAFLMFGFRVMEDGGFDNPIVQFNYGDAFQSASDLPAMIAALF